MYIYKVGVAGAGTMGAQIAEVVSFAGLPVVVADRNESLSRRGVDSVRAIYQARVAKGKMTPEQLEEKMLLVTASPTLDGLQEADLVIEAVSEELGLKQRVFQELDRICSRSAILASNTSALSISAIGSVTKRPGKVIGLHFFNPAYAMPLVEVIPGLGTDPQTVDDVVGFSESLRKQPVIVKECAGFLVNRLLSPYLNEAVWCLQDGDVSIKEIDQDMVSFGMPVGPFTLLDTVGLDIALDVARILHRSYGPRMAPAPLLEAFVKAGRIGIKTGKGFYDYGAVDKDGLDQHLARLRAQVWQLTGRQQMKWSRLRPLFAMVNEAVIALQEGVASARDIDLAMAAGTGFPSEKSGPLHLADHIGIDHVLQELEELQERVGPRFWPAPMLRRLVDAGFTGQTAGRGFFSYEPTSARMK
ncbi:MAG: putative 3-hydroxybutyryl-CoA epimerase [Nitrospira sp.]|nr:3-hydroxyacyl-CoA dehydrogenase [Nitrospira sp.]ULA61698.1 MAG: putative 3-hydroxybutyryl-CoA epimerase [Nitrospira sp.]